MSLKSPVSGFLLAMLLITSCKKKDTILPEISIKGSSFITIVLNTPYTDAGATATDNVDGELTVTATGTVDTNFAGTYYIVYKASDAAGNEAEATRTVVVKNEADVYNGSYQARSIIGVDTSYYLSPLTTSNILNQRIWLVGYSNDSAAAVYADLRHDTILILHQIVNTGIPGTIHAYSGSGFITTISDHTIFQISFRDSVSGNIFTGTSVYTKTN
jgi:hypothetical protein